MQSKECCEWSIGVGSHSTRPMLNKKYVPIVIVPHDSFFSFQTDCWSLAYCTWPGHTGVRVMALFKSLTRRLSQ